MMYGTAMQVRCGPQVDHRKEVYNMLRHRQLESTSLHKVCVDVCVCAFVCAHMETAYLHCECTKSSIEDVCVSLKPPV